MPNQPDAPQPSKPNASDADKTPKTKSPAAKPDAAASAPKPAASGTPKPAKTGRPSSMRTVLQQFADEFSTQIDPILDPIRHVERAVAHTAEGTPCREVLPTLRDLCHHFQALAEKVRQQHAYVLIFGPLKSGKSTFMNAMCASYVSEVSSLPAYPCLVHVSHAKKPSFSIIQYDATTQEVETEEELRNRIEKAHLELTQRLRELEAKGEEFDAAQHMPTAIRRIDVRLPTAELAESGAVLVDTPGLYSRMKFGYDRMTRDFRNAAACAIFVVKSDNLFLEQVFEEFEDLLDLFSRIFLVVNLDSSKKDLGPDGQLVPSLEHDAPKRIIDAFRNLSMSARLKEAADNGRLRIYPIDLLHAAGKQIRAHSPNAHQSKPNATGGQPEGAVDFETLRTDLTEFLNSSAYLQAFLADSLRRAETLGKDLGDALQHESLRALREELTTLEKQRDEAEKRLGALKRLEQVDWSAQVRPLKKRLDEAMKATVEELRTAADKRMSEAMEAWFEWDESLVDLSEKRANPLLKDHRDRFVKHLTTQLENESRFRADGWSLSAEVEQDLETAGVDIRAITANAASKAVSSSLPEARTFGLSPSRLPIRKGVLDWLLFRSQTAMRKRLFGPDEDPSRAVPSAVKTKRLGDPARTVVLGQAESDLNKLWEKDAPKILDQALATLVSELGDQVRQQTSKHQDEAAAEVQSLKSRMAEEKAVLDEAQTLQNALAKTSDNVKKLQKKYSNVESQNTPKPPAQSSAQTPAKTEQRAPAPPVAKAAPADKKPTDKPAQKPDAPPVAKAVEQPSQATPANPAPKAGEKPAEKAPREQGQKADESRADKSGDPPPAADNS